VSGATSTAYRDVLAWPFDETLLVHYEVLRLR